MFSHSTVLAVLGLATLASSHMMMNTPIPFGKSTLNNFPLDATGADFPCKQRTGVYNAEGASNTLALGEKHPLNFIGGATHGGGSCQISITYDKAPTKSSVFKVIHSIEGGCPIAGVAGNNGNSATDIDPQQYTFPVPSGLPTGDAVLAWTWFNKVGNREMYMNCAPVSITAGSAKRSAEDEELMARNVTQLMERDQAAYNALPDMYVANVLGACKTADNMDLKFPNPGSSLELLGVGPAALAAPVPAGCVAFSGGGSGSGSDSAPAATSAAAAAPAPTTTKAPALSGGVFATVAPPSATSAAASSQAPAPVAPAPLASSAAAAPAPVATGTTGSGSVIAAGTACTTEGMWNCIGGTSFQQCASGTWSVVQSLAAGTKCTAGQTMNINIVANSKKRSVRFPREHIHRHLQN